MLVRSSSWLLCESEVKLACESGSKTTSNEARELDSSIDRLLGKYLAEMPFISGTTK